MKVLVEAGADVTKTDRAKNTPEQIAKNKNYEQIVEFFESQHVAEDEEEEPKQAEKEENEEEEVEETEE